MVPRTDEWRRFSFFHFLLPFSYVLQSSLFFIKFFSPLFLFLFSYYLSSSMAETSLLPSTSVPTNHSYVRLLTYYHDRTVTNLIRFSSPFLIGATASTVSSDRIIALNSTFIHNERNFFRFRFVWRETSMSFDLIRMCQIRIDLNIEMTIRCDKE